MSWQQLESILQEQASYEDLYRSAEPVACPNDGEPLQLGPPNHPGVLFCPFDGWQYPRDYDATIHAGM